MDFEDFIIQTINENKKKKKKNYVDQVIDGTYEIEWEKSKYQDIAPTGTKGSDLVNNTKFVDAPVKKQEEKKWYQQILQKPTAFNDGYQFGDITKTVGGTVADAGVGISKGVIGIGENLGNLLVAGTAQVADWAGQDEWADEKRKKLAENPNPLTSKISDWQDKTIDNYSILGNTGDKTTEALGYIAGIWATGGAGAGVQTATMFGSATGGAASEVYQKDNVEDWQAWTKMLGTGAVETVTERLFGVFGTSGLDKGVANAISSKITSGVGKILARTGVAATSEAAEEFLSYAGSQGLDLAVDEINKVTGGDGATFKEEWNWEEVGEQMAVAFLASGTLGAGANVSSVVNNKTDANTWGEAINETAKQQDIEGQTENLTNELDKLNKKLKKETDPTKIQELQEEIRWKEKQQNALQDIAPVNTEAQKQGLEQAIVSKQEELKQSQDVREQQIIQEEIDQLNQELNEITNAQQITDGKQQRFVYEAQENDSDIKKAVYESAYVFDNTEKSHKFVDAVAKIAEERGTVYKFTNNEQLQQQGYTKEGLTINGLVNENGEVLINIDSAKSLNKVLGHETTHLLEGTQEYQDLKKMAIQYAKTTGEYDSRLKNLTKLYEGTNADIEAELTSDIVGDYLFTNEQFVQELSVQKPTLFQKIKALIDDLIVKFTGTEQEKQLRKLQKSFGKAYKNTSNQSTTDTKYSVSDNQGRTLTKEQQEYFKDSKVRDENGNLIKVYHGTNKAGFTEFKRNVNFFTDNKEVAQTYTGNDGIYEGYVNITNPITIDANGEIWSKIDVDNISIDGINNIRDFLNTYGASTWKEGGKLRTSTADLVSAIEDAIDEGEIVSDGVIIKNIYDEGSYSSSVGEKLGTDYITFNSNQFKNTDNTKPTTNPDIRYSLSESGKMVDNKGNEVKLEASETGTHGTLMATHNLNESKMNGILDLGGIPSPSIAIFDTNKMEHNEFGDVSLIFDSSTIDPSNKKNEVYDRDVWSPTFPTVAYDINNADINKMVKENNIYYNHKDDIASNAISRYFYESNLSSLVDRYGLEGTLKALKESSEMKYLYLQTVNDGNYKQEYKEKTYGNNEEITNDVYKRFLEIYDGKIPLNEAHNEYNEQIVIAMQQVIDNQIEKLKEHKDYNPEKLQAYREAYESIYGTGFVEKYHNVSQFLMSAYQMQKDIENNANNQVVDKKKTLEKAEKDINQQEYENWIDSTFGEMFKNTKKGIRNNKDLYTPSGNRRKFNQLHDEYNLQNILNYMIKQSTKGGQKTLFGGGFGKTSAQLATRFNSIDEIRNAKNRMMTREEAEKIIEPISSQLNDDMRELLPYHKKSSYRSDVASAMEKFEHIAEAVEEFAGKSNLSIANFKKVLNGWYSFDVDNIPNETLQKIIDDLKLIKELPTDYFEAKPQRIVELDEIKAVVIPNNASESFKQRLVDNGLNVVEYDPNIEGDRQAKINELDELKFSLSAQNEEIAPTGDWNIYGKDIKFQEQVQEAIAPLKETIENLTEQVQAMQENIAPVQEVKPTKPTLEEVQNLMNIKENQSGSDYASAFYALRDKYGQANLYKSLNEYYSTGTVKEESNVGNIDTTPASQEVVEQQNQEAFENITDNEAPKSFEDMVQDVMTNGDFETYSTPESTIQSPLENRDIDEVGNRSIKAYQYENPEVKPFFQAEADNMMYDLDNTIKGERIAIHDQEGYITDWTGTTRQTTEAIAYLKDNYGYSYDQIRKGLEAIIKDDGAENNAVSKRIEFMLDERLREGYTTSDGYPIPANEDYISFLEEKQITEYNKEAFNALTDEDAPTEIAPVKQEAKTYYHGTRGDFDTFDNNKIGQNYEGDWSSLGRGFYFTHDYDSAKEFGEASTNEGEVNVKEAQLDIKNPFYVDDITKVDKNILTNLQTKYELDEGSLANGYTLIDALKKKGFDSTDVLKQYGYDGIVAEDEVMVFDASQIKTKDTKTLQVDKSIAPTKKVAQNGNTQQLTPISELEEIKQEALQEESPEKLSQLLSRAEQLEGKESSFYENITETSKAYDETARSMFRDEADIKYYQGITNEQSLSEAKTRLDRGGNQEALRWINQDVKEATATDVAEGWILLKQYQDAQDYDSMVQIAKKMREIGTTSGQTVQAFNILSRLTPEGMVKYAVSELNEIKTKLTENKPKQWIDKNAEAFELTPNETAFIVNNMKEIQRMKEDGYIQNRVNELNAQKENLTDKKEIKKIDKDIKLLKNGNLEYAEKVKLAEIQAMLEDKLPPSLGQSINAWMRVSMLFNPKTQVRNVLGNAGIAPVNMVSDVIATALDKAISKQTKIRTKGLTDLKSYGLGFGKGLYESYSDFKRGINTRNVDGNRFEVKRGKNFTEKSIVGKTLNRIDNLNSFLLDAGDRGFYEAAFVNSINNQKVLNNTDTVTQDMINIATNEALERTWQDNNNYTQFVLNIRKGLNKVGFKDFGLGDILIPFAKTPANLTKAIIDYSPAGVVNAIKSGRNLKNSLKNSQFDPQMQHEFVSDVGKATAGTMLYILGYALATAGITSGEGDEDKDVKNFLKNTLGINSYSIEVGGHSFTYDWAQPLAAPLSIMANIVQGQEEEKELGELILSSLDTAGNLILEQSFMESINTVLSNNEGIATGLQEAIFGLPSRAIPTFSKQIADMTDGTTRQSFVAGKPLESAINQVKNKIPVLSTTLAPSVDTLGNEIQKYGGENTIYNVFFNPSTVNANKIKGEGAEIYRVYEATGDATVMPRVAPYSVKTKEGTIQLDPQQRAEFQKISGDIVKDNVSNLLKNSDYKAMADTKKAEVLNNIVNYAYNKAQSEVAGTELSDAYKAVVSFENIGGNASDYYTIKGQISKYDADYESSKEELSAKHNKNSDTYEEKVGELSATKKKNVVNTILNTNLTDQQKAFMYGKEYSSEETINKILDTADSFDNFLRYETSTVSMDKDDDKKKFLQKSDYSDNDKVAIYENVICSDFDNEKKYKGYKTAKAAQIDINSWLALDSQEFKADKNSKGESISGSKKKKVIKYVNSLELTIPEKAILIKASNNFKFNDYNNDIISYLNGLDLEYEEKVNILENLDMTVSESGTVYWK